LRSISEQAIATGDASITASSVFFAWRSSFACSSRALRRRSSEEAIRLKASASLPNSPAAEIDVRWLSSPDARIAASRSSWRNGRMMRPDSIQAMSDPMAMAKRPNSPLNLSLVTTGMELTAIGMPTTTSHGVRYAVE